MKRFTVLVALLGCSSEGPRWEWPTSTPEEQGMNSATLEGARAYAFAPGKNTQGVVVTRRGTLVAEWYEEGRDANSYGASWSVGKSFASAIVGIAIAEGKIPNVQKKLVDYYPQWAGSPREDITLEHVLQQSTGLRRRAKHTPTAAWICRRVTSRDSACSTCNVACGTANSSFPLRGSMHR